MTQPTRLLLPGHLVWMLVLAALVRGIAIVAVPEQHLPDIQSYRTAADEFGHLRLMTDNNIMPLYPLLVAVLGPGWGQKFADLVLSVASVWLIYVLAFRVYRRQSVAILAGLFAALWPHFIFFAAIGLTETLFVAMVLAAFASFYDERYVLGSACMVLAILTRPAIEVLAPVLVLMFALVIHRRGIRFAAMKLLTYGLIYVGLMSPWWLHNYAKYGQFVRLNLAGGMVLYTGNNPLNRSGGGVGKIDVDWSPFDSITDSVARDQALTKAAMDYIRADPAHFISMAVVKLARLWRPWPHSNEYSSLPIIFVSAASFIPMICLGLWGLVGTLRMRFVVSLPIFAYLGFLTLVHMVTFGSIRYRIPLEPFVLIFAAAGAVDLMSRFGAGRHLLTRLAGPETAKLAV